MPSGTLVQLRRVCLNPPPDTAGIHEQAAFGQQLGNVKIRQRVSEIPPYCRHDHIAGVMASLEWIRRADRHGLPTLPDRPTQHFATEPEFETSMRFEVFEVIEATG